MRDRKKKNALTPKETEQAVSNLAERLAEMDKAEGVFGESMEEELSDEYLDEIAGEGQIRIKPTPSAITDSFINQRPSGPDR